jgi:hypothetical protein
MRGPADFKTVSWLTFAESCAHSYAANQLYRLSLAQRLANRKGQVTNMQDKKKRTKKAVKVGDLKPAKDPKGGGMPQGSPQDVKSLLKLLQLGQGPGR